MSKIKAVLRMKNVRTKEMENKDVEVLTPLKRFHFPKGEFVVMNKSLARLLKTKNAEKLTGLDFRVLMCLIERTDANNRVRTFKQIQLAEELETSQANVSRTIRKLIQLNILKLDDLDYYFNDEYIFTGGKKDD